MMKTPSPRPTRRKASAGTRAKATVPDLFRVLRERIANQSIAPGAKLRETDLAAEYGVPRSRIRDALAALEQRGLVVREPNRGAIVTKLDLSQVFHIYDLREALEGLAARLATERMPPEHWQADLALFKGPMKEHVDRGNFDAYIEQYEAFRLRIIDAAGNPVLKEMLDIIFEKTQVLIRRIIILPGRAEQGRRQHLATIEAMRRGDAAEAERLRREGLRSAKSTLEKYQRYVL